MQGLPLHRQVLDPAGHKLATGHRRTHDACRSRSGDPGLGRCHRHAVRHGRSGTGGGRDGCWPPPSITSVSSDMTSASRWSWATLMAIIPSSCRMRRNSSCMSSRSLWSSSAGGSPSRIRSGWKTSARTIASRDDDPAPAPSQRLVRDGRTSCLRSYHLVACACRSASPKAGRQPRVEGTASRCSGTVSKKPNSSGTSTKVEPFEYRFLTDHEMLGRIGKIGVSLKIV